MCIDVAVYLSCCGMLSVCVLCSEYMYMWGSVLRSRGNEKMGYI